MTTALFTGTLDQRLRLISGLVLVAYAASHFINHALGLLGIEQMLVMQQWRTAFTRSIPGTALLLAAILAHVSLGLVRIAGRRTLAMPRWEAVQIVTGLTIPLLLIPHVVGTRIAATFYGVQDDYVLALIALWPARAIEQSALLLLVWLHGMIGLHHWLRLSPAYRRLQPWLLGLAVAIPLLGLAGFSVAGREIERVLLESPETLDVLRRGARPPDSALLAHLQSAGRVAQWCYLALLGGVGALMLARQLHAMGARTLTIHYADGPAIRSAPGPTLLEMSRAAGVPHASVCGGRARCSTCRVRIGLGLETLPPPGPAERTTLQRIGAPASVRLACQIRPTADLAVIRLVSPGLAPARALALGASEAHGVERMLAVMFLDVRGFAQATQHKLPYDIVFLLNRLFAHLVPVIEREGGWIDKFIGDGLMAVFGREVGLAAGCRQALAAARAVDLELSSANDELAGEFGQPVSVGIGLHAGPMVLGTIGHGASASLTVMGATVNAASRLEALTKDEQCQLLVSRSVLEHAGVPLTGFEIKALAVRGLDEPLPTARVVRARDLGLEAPAATDITG